MVWIAIGASLMLAAGVLLALCERSPRLAAATGLFVVVGAYRAMIQGTLPISRPGAQLGLYHLFVGDILLFALVASYHGSRPPRPK